MAYPPLGLVPWVALPKHILKAFNGRSSLPVHEIDKAKVEKPRAHIRPFTKASGEVTFSAWRLAHAIKKADCARSPSAPFLWVGAAGFILENAYLFDWSRSELSLNNGMASLFADFSASGLAGRIAQGMALLFLEDKEYTYVGRFETEWTRRAVAQNRTRPADLEKAPDFIAENKDNDWVLAESKGGFASPDTKPNIKGALNEGLDQLRGWDQHIAPQPTKSFVIGTYLRENSDASDETSLIAFVDPEPERPIDPVEFPADAVRRANYASWLSLMGFDDAAVRVRIDVGEPQRRSVPIISIAGRKYVVSVVSVSPSYPDLSSREFWDDFEDWPFGPFGWSRRGMRIELIGLDLEVIQVLGSAQSSLVTSGLMGLKPQVRGDAVFDRDGGAFYGSILADGSLFGELRLSHSGRLFPDFEWIEVGL